MEPVRGNHASCHVLQGYGACASRRQHFDIERLHLSLASQPEAFRFSDDVILSNHIASRGVARFTIELASRLEHMPWGDEDSQSLKFVDRGPHSLEVLSLVTPQTRPLLSVSSDASPRNLLF